jgi:hypothetical protein
LERDQRPQRYRAFLLRCCEVRDQRPAQAGAWRFRLEDVQTGEKRGFADADALVAFLRKEFDANGGRTDRRTDGGRR